MTMKSRAWIPNTNVFNILEILDAYMKPTVFEITPNYCLIVF